MSQVTITMNTFNTLITYNNTLPLVNALNGESVENNQVAFSDFEDISELTQ